MLKTMLLLKTMPRTRILLTLAALGALAICGRPAQADLVFGTTPTSAGPGGAGSFDVTLTDTAGSSPAQISGFTFGLSVPLTSGITFEGVTMNTGAPYIFNGASFDAQNGLPLSGDTFPTQTFTASDISGLPAGFVTLAPGQTVGLGQVAYSVDPATVPGPVPLSFDAATTSLADGSGNALSFSTMPGTITVSPAPEPTGWVTMAGMGVGLGLLIVRARRRGSAF